MKIKHFSTLHKKGDKKGRERRREKNIKSTTKTKEHQRNPENPHSLSFHPCPTLFHSDLSPLFPSRQPRKSKQAY